MNTVYMMIGVPGSGKSTYSSKLGIPVFSSDELRKEMFGTLSKQDKVDHQQVFNTLNEKVNEQISLTDVVYDATNLNRKKRIHFKNNVLKNGKVHAVVVIEPFGLALARNKRRKDVVPTEKVKQMYEAFQVPKVGLDCDSYEVIGSVPFFKDKVVFEDFLEMESVYELYNKMSKVYQDEVKKNLFGPHDTPYHLERIDEHIDMCIKNSPSEISHVIALFHDLGKAFTKDGGKYIGHQNVSAMYAMKAFSEIEDMESETLILEGIYHHMSAHQGITSKLKKRYKITDEELDVIEEFAAVDSRSRIVAPSKDDKYSGF